MGRYIGHDTAHAVAVDNNGNAFVTEVATVTNTAYDFATDFATVA